MLNNEEIHDMKKSQVKLQPYQDIDILLPELFRSGALNSIINADNTPLLRHTLLKSAAYNGNVVWDITDNNIDLTLRRLTGQMVLSALCNMITPFTVGLVTEFQSIQGIYARILQFPMIHELNLSGMEINESKFSQIINGTASCSIINDFMMSLSNITSLDSQFVNAISKFERDMCSLLAYDSIDDSVSTIMWRTFYDYFPQLRKNIIPAKSIMLHLKAVTLNDFDQYSDIQCQDVMSTNPLYSWTSKFLKSDKMIRPAEMNDIELYAHFESQYERVRVNFNFFYDIIKEMNKPNYKHRLFESSLNGVLGFLAMLNYSWYNSGWVQPFVKMSSKMNTNYKDIVIKRAVKRYKETNQPNDLYLYVSMVNPRTLRNIEKIFLLKHFGRLITCDHGITPNTLDEIDDGKIDKNSRAFELYDTYRSYLRTYHLAAISFTSKEFVNKFYTELSTRWNDANNLSNLSKTLPPLIRDVLLDNYGTRSRVMPSVEKNYIRVVNITSPVIKFNYR